MSDNEFERESGDAERVRDALRRHAWPAPGEALMARLRAIPDEAPSRTKAVVDGGRDEDGRAVAETGSRASRPSGRLEALGAIAIVAAVVLVILRGTGRGIAPADAPERAAADATRTAEEARTAETLAGAMATPVAGGEEGAGDGDRSPQVVAEHDGPEPTSAVPLPEPPLGTRLYGSVAELLADPPAPGETVWVDAYHGEIIMTYPGWGRASSMSGCPNLGESPLLDRPHLLQYNAFDFTVGSPPPDPGSEPVLVAAGVVAEGGFTTMPDLPRRGRLVLHLGDPAMAACEEAGRIAVVERVAHVFEEKTDWLALAGRIRGATTNGEASGSSLVADPDGGPDIEIGAYEVGIPQGLEVINNADPSYDLGYFYVGLALPELPDHPIVLKRYLPGEPEHEPASERVVAQLAEGFGAVYRQQEREGLAGGSAATGPRLEFVIEGLLSETGERLALGAGEIAAMTIVDDVVYRISVTPPADPLAAQPLLWWLETVVDRFRVPEVGGSDGVAIERSGDAGGGLEVVASIDVAGEIWAVAAHDGRVLAGGPRLSVLQLAAGDGSPVSNALLDLPSPEVLGLTSEHDVERVAMQVTGGDREAARAMLASDSALSSVQALAIRATVGYAAVEWPRGSGLVWLYAIDIETPAAPSVLGAVRLADPAEAASSPYVSVVGGMEVVGDRVLVATSGGLLEVDVSDRAAPRVLARDPELRGVLSGLTVAPDGGRAWAVDGSVSGGGLVAIDLSGPSARRGPGGLAADAAFLDVASDGVSAFVATGDEASSLRVLDVGAAGGSAREIARIAPVEGRPFRVALHGGRLFALAMDLTSEIAASAYPGPLQDGPVPAGLFVFDVADPTAPELVWAEPLPSPRPVMAVDAATGDVLIGDGHGDVRVYRAIDWP